MENFEILGVSDKYLNFLNNNCKVLNNKRFTNTRMDGIKCTYNITGENYDEFLKHYTSYVFDEDNEEFITEKHEEIGPLVIDLDFRFKLDAINKRKYTFNHILDFIKLYMSKIELYFDIEQDKERWAFVFEKENPVITENCMKDGVHIMFPYIISTPEIQYIIREDILNEINHIFGCLDLIDITDPKEGLPYSNIVDKAVIKNNGWLLYGSKKNTGSQSYKLTNIIEINNDNYCKKDINQYPKLSLVKLLSIRNKTYKSSLKESMNDLITERSKKYIVNINKDIVSNKSKKNKTDNFDQIKQYIDILSAERAKNFQSWIEVGWCLHNIDYRLLDKWIEFSKKSDNHSNTAEKECVEKWLNMGNDGLNIGTLHRWCMIDNKKKYDAIRRNDLRALLLKSINLTHTDIANVILEMYKYKYTCGSIKNKIWYEFDGRWKELDDGITLRKYISGPVVDEYLILSSEYSKKATEFEQDDPSKESFIHKSKNLNSVTLKLRNVTFKKSLMQECQEKFWEENFINKLDSNPNLVGFENGIYDLENLDFRAGYPEDYVSMTTGIDYIKYDDLINDTESQNYKYLEEIQLFMKQIQPKQENREYVLMVLASSLDGNTNEERFNVWTGTGGNGKSKLIELFEFAFGDYCCKLPVSVLTQKRGKSSAASPELERTKGKRFACLQEPDEDEEIRVGMMKELTGGDKIMARALFKDPVEFKPQFKMTLTCNKLPKVPAEDGGTWRRMKVMDYQSEFVDNPDPENPNQFPIDYNLSSKLQEWASPFMSLLVEYYKKYKLHGLKDPPDVIAKTLAYKNYNNMYEEYLKENIIHDPACCISITNLYEHFKPWYKEEYDVKPPTKKEFKNYISKKYSTNKTTIKGITIKADEDEMFID